MASIEQRRGKFFVRWRDPDGGPRSRTCPDEKTAWKIKLDIERAVAEGKRWQPRDARPEPDLVEILESYSRRCARVLAEGTALRYAQTQDVFVRWLRVRYGARVKLTGSLLSSKLLEEFFGYLGSTGLHGRARGLDTRRKNVEVIQLAWKFAANSDEYADFVPPPRTIEMPRSPAQVPVAPRWAEVDAFVWRLTSWNQQVALLMRFTGLRVAQTTFLTWPDVDLDRASLIIRGELGKSKQEKRGRVVPISPHLVEILRAWGPQKAGYIVDAAGARGGDRERMVRQKAMRKAWADIEAREDIWRGRPSHAIRKGFISELKRAGADDEAVEYLVGHSLRLRGVYNDPDALPLRDAVALVPPLSPPPSTAPAAGTALWSLLRASRTADVEAESDEKVVRLADVVLRNRNRPNR